MATLSSEQPDGYLHGNLGDTAESSGSHYRYFGLSFVHGSEAGLRPTAEPGTTRNPDVVDIGELVVAVNLGSAHIKKTGSTEAPGIIQKPDRAGNPENSEQQSLGKKACETKWEEESRYVRTNMFWETSGTPIKGRQDGERSKI